MKFICMATGCTKETKYECLCKERFRLCRSDMKKHSKVSHCKCMRFDPNILIDQITSGKNAVVRVISGSIKLAEKMTNEVNICLKESLRYLKELEKQIEILIVGGQKENVDNIILWANSMDFTHRDTQGFMYSTRNLLDISSNYAKEINKLNELQNEVKNLRSTNITNDKKINEQEKNIAMYKKLYQDKENEVKEYAKKYDDIRVYNKKYEEICKYKNHLEEELERKQNLCKNYQVEIGNYDIEAKNANSKIKALTNELESAKNKLYGLVKKENRKEKIGYNVGNIK